jgi:hypothetical protein
VKSRLDKEKLEDAVVKIAAPKKLSRPNRRSGKEAAVTEATAAAGAPSTPDAGERRARRRLAWAELLERCFEIDATRCGKCGGILRLISVIEDRAVVKRILDHLGLRSTPPRPTRPRRRALRPIYPGRVFIYLTEIDEARKEPIDLDL